jgi:rubredoxin
MTTIGFLILLRTLAYLRGGSSSSGKVITNATRYRCVPCGWIYDEKYGDPDGGIAPGTRFEDIPEDWICPVCGVSKNDFVPYEETYEQSDSPASVIATTLLNPTTLQLVIETTEVFTVIPGQYARIAMKDRDGIFYRSYSVVESDGKKLTFCIKLTSGRGGYVLRNLKIGELLGIEGVYGSFVLKNNNSPKVFIATGTGLAPLINMIRQIPDEDKILLF